MRKTKMLKKNFEFKNILEKGKFYGGEQIVAFILKKNRPENYLGIAIGKKAGNSVYRNKAKRLIKENYRLLEDNIKLGYSLIFLWNKKNKLENANFYTIEKDMKNILKRAGIIEK